MDILDNLEEKRREINELVGSLNKHQDEYYRLARPVVSDLEYDRLFDKLTALEKEYPELINPNSPTQRVGSELSQEFPEAAHTIPVLSLDKCYSYEELRNWIKKLKNNLEENISFILEEKIDGASIVLYYEKGELVRAVTRGNGFIGNDITGNVKTIKSVPLRLAKPVDLAVRGEIFLPKELFDNINSKLEVPYANPRNLAAGTLRRKKSSEVARVPLDIFIYEGYFKSNFNTHLEILNELNELGFKLNYSMGYFTDCSFNSDLKIFNSIKGAAGINKINNFIVKETNQRNSLSYEIDGLVLKVNEIHLREKLGYTGHHPRWAVAYKFDSPTGKTKVNEITVQIGRTGRVTPVARVEPVQISGSVISNITLHNQEYINMLELSVCDTVEVSKRGDVIPAIEKVLEKNEKGHSTWKMPLNCVTCSGPLKQIGAHLFCVNDFCEDRIRAGLHFFVAKSQMDIDNFGPETIDFLFEHGIIKNVEDIYYFDPKELLDKPGFGEKKVELIIKGIEKSKQKDFKTVLVALGIPELGKKAADLLIGNGYSGMDKIMELALNNNVEALLSIHGIGVSTAENIFNELLKPSLKKRIEALKKAGLNFNQMEKEQYDGELIFIEQVWCVTGSFEHFQPRSKAEEEIEKRGGRIVTAVTSKTTHLLKGQGGGSKIKKAAALGINIVEENSFLDML